MSSLDELLRYNRGWATDQRQRDPAFFTRQSAGQRPAHLVIGCSDSRVPIEQITGAEPGEMFVQRNIANQAHPADLNVQAVIAYAIDALEIRDVMVVGHTGCGGVRAAMSRPHHGIVDHWLGDIRALWRRHKPELVQMPSEEAAHDRLVSLNVLLQVFKLVLNPTVRDAWDDGRPLRLHGYTYDIETGLLRPEVVGIDSFVAAKAKLAGFDPA